MPPTDMENAIWWTEPGGLTLVGSPRTRSRAHFTPHTFDLVAISDPFLKETISGDKKFLARNWAPHWLSEAFGDARIVALGVTDLKIPVANSPATIEAFSVQVLVQLLMLRRSTNTSDRPFAVLIQSTSGIEMLSKLVLSLITVLGAHFSVIELASNLRGVFCLETSRNDHGVANNVLTEKASDLFSNNFVADAPPFYAKNVSKKRIYSVPVTVLLDERGISDELVRHCFGSLTHLSMIFSRLGDESSPLTSVSRKRVIGEIRRFLAGGIDRSLSGAEEAHIQHWLSPSKALFQYEPLPTKDVFGDWLFRHHSYTSWLYSDQSDLLWITGKPGSGKSTLSKLFVDGIRANAFAFPQHAIVAAVFFDFRCILARKGESARGLLLRALLYQILETDPSILSGFRNSLSSITPLPERPEDLDDHHYERCLRAALLTASANGRVFIVIDGLDECAPAVQDDLMDCIQSIYMPTWFRKKVRVIITSRWAQSMRKVHEAYPTRKIHLEEENNQAIQDYSWAMLCSRLVDPAILLSSHASPAWDSLRRLATDITHRANGTFLWVRLVIDMLLVDYPARKVLSESMEEWHKAIQDIPTELDSLYETIVSRIPHSVRSTFRSVATWCMFAVRPLSLDELRAALLSEPGHNDHALIESFYQNGASYLECIGQGLIEVVHDPNSRTRRVRLVHQSAKAFLEGSGARHIMPIGAAHTHISNTCIRYALPILEAESQEGPLLDYSVVNWGYHAEIGDTFGHTQDFLLHVVDSQFLERFISLDLKSTQPNQSQAIVPGSSKPLSVIHIAASYGLRNTILARSRQDHTEKNPSKNALVETTALHRASESGHYNTIVALLDLGADVNAVDLDGRTSLHLAARGKHEAVCRLLLERGANVNIYGTQKDTVLHHAVRTCGVDTIKLLLEAGADPSVLDQHGDSILNLAITSGNEAVAELLLLLIDTNWPPTSFGRALVFAASRGLIDLVQSMLQSGCFVDPNDPFIQQALVAAIVCEHEDMVLIILGSGCHPDIHDYQHGQSALSIAAASGNGRIAMSLLQHGADPNLHDLVTRSTPLMHAIAHGRPAIVRLLFDYGANMADPLFSYMSAGEGWLFSIVSALIRQCPNARKAAQDKGRASNTLTSDSTKPKENNKRNSGPKRKRHRPEDSGSENEENHQDDQVSGKKTCTREQWPCACPFEKMFPHQHECGPKDGVNRLKEHLYRRHVKVFCPDCWEIFPSENLITVHLRTDSCAKTSRANFSQGICSEQVKDLRKRCYKMPQEEQWQRAFRIIFPDHQGEIPSSNYEDVSEAMRGAARIMTDNPRFQDQLGTIVGARHVQQVCRLILNALGESERSVQIAEISSTIHVPSNTFDPTTNMHANQVGVANGWFSSYQHPTQSFALPTMAAQLPYVPQLSQPSIRQPHSDSGFSSRAPEPMRVSNERSMSFFHLGQATNATPTYPNPWLTCLNNASHVQHAGATASMPATTPYFNRMPPWARTHSTPGNVEEVGNSAYSSSEHNYNQHEYTSSEDILWRGDSSLQDPQGASEQQFN